MKVSIVIPNYNTWDLVKRNVDALVRLETNNFGEIIVVDDCSPIENYILFYDKVRIIRNKTNLHYSGAVNIGLQSAKHEIIVLLDSDAYITKPFLKQLLAIYDDNLNIGCVGFKTVDNQGNDTGNTMPEPSVLSLISGQYLHGKLRKYNLFASKNIMPFSCAVSFRKSCLDEVGYLDAIKFPVLDADQDLSMRIHRSTWKLIYEPSIEVFHIGGGSISKDGDRVIKFYESRILLLDKFNKVRFKTLTKLLILFRLKIEEVIFLIKRNSNQIVTRKRLQELVEKW